MQHPGSSSEAIRLTAHDIPASLHRAISGSMLQNSDLLLQVVDHVLLLLVHPAYQRHHYLSEHVHFGFLQSQTEKIHLGIPSLLSPQPIEGPQLTLESNFWTLRDLVFLGVADQSIGGLSVHLAEVRLAIDDCGGAWVITDGSCLIVL